ncbi:MAG: methyl-accepting chemotaxis protein [Pseudobutyrivibrio sp.]|nr:methyl-accepting chemotaxis protein [Pseudobutyrivibrio sp.]
MNTTSKNSIIRKVVGRVIKALLVTVLALSVVNLIFMSRQLMKEVKTEVELVTVVSADKVDGWTSGLECITQDIADSLTGIESIDETTVKHILNEYAKHHDELYFLYVATEEGNMYMARGVQYAAGVDPRERAWYKAVKAAGHTIVTDPYMSATRKDVMLVTAATPIYFGTRMVGIVGVDADVHTINEYIEGLEFRDGAYGFLIDTQGNIIAHKNSEFLPTSEKVTNVSEAIPELVDIVQKPGSKLVKAKDYRGEEMLYSTTRLEDSKWTVGLAYPSKAVYKTLDRGIRICLFTALVCILFAAGDIRAAIKRMLKPIEKINPVLDGVIRGDFSVDLELTKEQDELGLLQQKLVLIIRRLGEIISEQKHVLGEMENGNLIVEDIETLPGELNEISMSVNSIKAAFNDIISDIQFSAINLQSYAMGINETTDLEEMKMIFEELSAEANALMDKTSRFITMPGGLVNTSDTVLDDTQGADYSEDE